MGARRDIDIGFTGTHHGGGLTTEQHHRVIEVLVAAAGGDLEDIPLKTAKGKLRFHHGDAVGADAEAHMIARVLGYEIHVHPPNRDDKRAFCEGDVTHEPAPYLRRNEEIVRASQLLVACPRGTERPGSLRGQGTWWTITKALELGVPVWMIGPNGERGHYHGEEAVA